MNIVKMGILMAVLGLSLNVYAADEKILLNPAYCIDSVKTLDTESAKFKYVVETLKKNLYLKVVSPGQKPQWTATSYDINKVYKSLSQDDIPTLIFLLTQNGVAPEVKGLIQETLKLFGQDSIICMDSLLTLKTTKNPQIVEKVKVEVLKSLNK